MIKIHGLHKHYEGQQFALQDINLTIPLDKPCFVTGRSGAGKSTFLRLLAGLDIPSAGTIDLFNTTIDRDTCCAKRSALRRHMGVVLQDGSLIDRATIAENVALPLVLQGVSASVREKRVRAALQRVGLAPKHGVCPPQLSSGEKQRANLARAIVHHPKLIVADEPTGNLDPDLSVDMMRLLSTFQEAGVGLIIATHDVYLMDQFPHYRLHLRDGMVDYDESDWESVT